MHKTFYSLSKPQINDSQKTIYLGRSSYQRALCHVTATASCRQCSFNEKKSAWVTDAGVYRFLVCSSAEKVEAQANVRVDKYVAKVHNVLKPKVKLDLLHR